MTSARGIDAREGKQSTCRRGHAQRRSRTSSLIEAGLIDPDGLKAAVTEKVSQPLLDFLPKD
jgi:hypothetical protein